MDTLAQMQPSTAWAAVVAIALIMGGVIAVVALLMPVLRKIRRFEVGKVRGETGKPEEVVRVRRTSLEDEELDRISDRSVAKIAPVLADTIRAVVAELGHDCIQRPILGAVASTIEPVCTTLDALAARAIDQGANGLIKSGRERMGEALDGFRKVQAERLVG